MDKITTWKAAQEVAFKIVRVSAMVLAAAGLAVTGIAFKIDLIIRKQNKQR